jgi:antitoxin component YwqK of YwqJK toxin-antitoxin module
VSFKIFSIIGIYYHFMRSVIVILIFLPSILFGQKWGYREMNLKDGAGIDTEYGTPLMGYIYDTADHSRYGKITAITEYKNKKINGRHIQFFSYPYDTASVEFYKEGVFDGAFYYRYRDGKLWYKGIAKNGIIVEKKYWTEKGEKVSNAISYNESDHSYYSNNKQCNGKVIIGNGHTNVYFNDGKIDSIDSYGFAYWGISMEIKQNYIDSTRQYINYYEHGNIAWIRSEKIVSICPTRLYILDGMTYLSDCDKLVQDGKFIDYYDDGRHTIKSITFYKNDLRVGEWKFYSERSILDSTIIFENDKFIKTIKN